MNTLAARLNRYFRVVAVSLSLTVLLLTVCLAEGWSTVKKPTFPPVSVTSSLIIYSDGSTLTADGTYTTGGVAYSEPAAVYDDYGNLDYPEGTILYPDGSWISGSN